MSNVKAATLHLILSLVIVTMIITLMYALWYPEAYFKLMGGTNLILLMAGVDVFLGPLLTLIVFKPNKKSLKFDLSCIAMLQIAAMSYGMYVMFEARPVFIVFNKTTFQVASVVDIDARELAKAKKEEWRTLSITGPRLVAINPDKNNEEEMMLLKYEGEAACRYPRLYGDYKKRQVDVLNVGKSLTILSEFSADNKQAVDSFIKKVNRPSSNFLFLPITSAVTKMAAIVDAKTGAFVKILDVRPFANNSRKDQTTP